MFVYAMVFRQSLDSSSSVFEQKERAKCVATRVYGAGLQKIGPYSGSLPFTHQYGKYLDPHEIRGVLSLSGFFDLSSFSSSATLDESSTAKHDS